jgi:hypothetical protein
MSSYKRSTQECNVSQLQPELLQAIRAYFKTHEFGDVETECRLCCETVAEKQPGSSLTAWLDAKEEQKIVSAVLLTDQLLVWARAGEQTGAHVSSARLHDIRVKPASSLFSSDTGLAVMGLIENSRVNIRGTIGMGAGSEAQKFCEETQKAIEKINPTPERKLPSWLGGRR